MNGFWLNASTGQYVHVHEHAMALQDRLIVKQVGVPESVCRAVQGLHPADPRNRVKILMAGFSGGLIRIRFHHRAHVTFEFGGSSEVALRAISLFLKKTQLLGPLSIIRLHNIRARKGMEIRYDAFQRKMMGRSSAKRLAKEFIPLKI